MISINPCPLIVHTLKYTHIIELDTSPATNNFFFFNDPATPEISPLPLHDALPISGRRGLPPLRRRRLRPAAARLRPLVAEIRLAGLEKRYGTVVALRGITLTVKDGELVALLGPSGDRKSTRLNSSHGYISYAVFCL